MTYSQDDSGATRALVEKFGMMRHPTAGWYTLHYSDSEMGGRPKLTSLYRLLVAGERVEGQKGDSIQVWHYHFGAPAAFEVSSIGGGIGLKAVLGTDLAAGQRPQLAVPAYHHFSCETLGAWTMLGCTAAPGFTPNTKPVIDAGA